MTTDVPRTRSSSRTASSSDRIARPRNLAQVQKGSIHDDATASKLGFRGGTVAGSIHMEQFPPVLLRAFGQQWFETGSLSCYFRNATLDGERVRPLAQVPSSTSDAQINIWMERDDGLQVLEGTASVGNPAEPSLLRRKLEEPRDPGEMRMLAHVTVGQQLTASADARQSHGRSRDRRAPQGHHRAARLVHRLFAVGRTDPQPGPPRTRDGRRAVRHPPVRRRSDSTAPSRVRHHAGPAFHDRDYVVDGNVLALGVTPKTEYVWFETMLRDREGAPPIASMIMMLRFMKASSPLWAD